MGDEVFVHMPAAKACKAYKFVRPIYGPYNLSHSRRVRQPGVVVCLVDQLQADPIRVDIAYYRILHCTDLIPNVFWSTGARVTQTRSRGLTGNFAEEAITQTIDAVNSGSESVSSRPGMNKSKQWLIEK